MRPALVAVALLVPLTAPASAATKPFLCADAAGGNAFRLDFSEQGYYNIASEPDSMPIMFGGGGLSQLEGSTSFEVRGGPLEEDLGALYVHMAGSGLSIDVPSGAYHCQKSKS